ncbi:hypothetical protein Aph01nite_64060 [Acrocarpospora phusangensis]|uniref:RNA polymerase sigma-70 region 2 domain-containing protein n=1 Tax=Acrocarpospora phusangensis TaxID=1070424 RepID=A0A919UN52_9ACTN|nr:sigma factor [Acrocarpospora phusangensis]GIH28096.1 hypothetical protein Aph01nite_64060 [Acrocarpospora phusangensis]
MTEAAAESLADLLDERRHLLNVALWMFGSATAADQIVQETYRRWYALDDTRRAAITTPRAWLTRVTGGICLDLLATTATGAAATLRPGPPAFVEVRHRPGQTTPDLHNHAVRGFAAACHTGDTTAIRKTLAVDAMVVSDTGGKLRTPAHPTYGADAVTRFVAPLLTRHPGTDMTVESVNGRTGLVLRRSGRAVAVTTLSVAGSEITAIWIVLNPDKLHHWHHP